MDSKDHKYAVKQAIVSFLLKHPFYGHLISHFKWVPDERMPTLATDGATIYYNPKFFMGLDVPVRVFAIGHEILHCVLGHVGKSSRLGDRDPAYWNMATDYAINLMLEKQKVGKLWEHCLYDVKYDGMSSEQIYAKLMKGKPPIKDSMDQHMFTQGNGSGSDSDSSSPSRQIPVDIQKEMAKDSDEKMEKFKDAVIQAYQISKQAGKVPGGLESVFEELLEPKIDWRTLLQVSIQSIFKNDRTWARPNRRTLDPRYILPSMNFDDTVDICISMDTSGSITEDRKREFLSEVAGILQYYTAFKLKVWCFDTKVSGFKEYDQSNIQDLTSYVLTGGGGTDIKCNFDYMQENDIIPKQFIVFTDAYNYSNDWGPEDYCSTVWIVVDNEKPNPPFGTWALFPKEK